MSSLNSIEKRAFEDLFGMASGYVLDFTNHTFAEFFQETAGIDIYAEKYAFNGASKAKRLRAFWRVENDQVVANALEGLLSVWGYEFGTNSKDDPVYKRCIEVVARLKGEAMPPPNHEKDTESDFFNRTFVLPDLRCLNLDSIVTNILEQRLQEIEIGMKAQTPLAVVFLCGSILEGALLGTALKMPEVFNRATASPKSKEGRVRPFHEWKLVELIEVACEIEMLDLDIKKFGHALRDFRNYIHPYEQMASRFSPDQHTAEICFHVLKAALAGLGKQRKQQLK